MTNNTVLARSAIIYAICLPLAIFLGYLITDPLDKTTDITFGVVLFLLVLPLLLKWYHAWLIVIWNSAITFMFLPGLFPAWIPIGCIGFAVAVGHYVLNRERKFLGSVSVARSLMALGVIVFLTAKFRGGLGFHALGDESIGGKRYVWIWAAIFGYFALVSQPIPPEKRKLYAALFLLAPLTYLISQFAGYAGPVAAALYLFIPPSAVWSQTHNPMAGASLEQYGQLATASLALVLTLVAFYGIDGIAELKRPWRGFLFICAAVLTMFGGYRSLLLIIALTLILMFYFQGLFRSRLLPVAVLMAVLGGGVILAFSERLPLSIQRCLAILPVKINAEARISAESSSDWRLEIWQSLLPQVPHYLLFGKGMTFDASDMAMYQTLGNTQVGGDVGGGLTLAGDYHNGPLSLVIPFGIWGTVAFLWFLWASLRVLWKNHKYGDPEIKTLNTLLLSYFITKTIMFFFVFGGFYSDLFGFVGLVGFSTALNHGVAAKPVPEAQPQVLPSRARLFPMSRPVASH